MRAALRTGRLRLAHRTEHRTTRCGRAARGTRQLHDHVTRQIERRAGSDRSLRAIEQRTERDPADARTERRDRPERLVPGTLVATLVGDAAGLAEQTIQMQARTDERRLT